MYDSVLGELSRRKYSIKRSELTGLLESLGFKIREGNKGKHSTYTHKAFVMHPGGAFNGEHGKDGLIKMPYILDAIKIIRAHQEEIMEYIGEKK